MGRPSLITIIYIAIGIVVAANRDYFGDLDGLQDILSALLAVVLWPLILLGVDLDLGGDGGRDRNNGALMASWVAARLALARVKS